MRVLNHILRAVTKYSSKFTKLIFSKMNDNIEFFTANDYKHLS